jgi:hypothetical protein
MARRLLAPLVLAAALTATLCVTGSASALVLDYCGPGRGYIAPNSWCYQNNPHYWDYNQADGYSDGRHTWPVCEAIKTFYSRDTFSRVCNLGTAHGSFVNCGLYMDAGVANDESFVSNYIYGHAESYPNAGC